MAELIAAAYDAHGPHRQTTAHKEGIVDVRLDRMDSHLGRRRIGIHALHVSSTEYWMLAAGAHLGLGRVTILVALVGLNELLEIVRVKAQRGAEAAEVVLGALQPFALAGERWALRGWWWVRAGFIKDGAVPAPDVLPHRARDDRNLCELPLLGKNRTRGGEVHIVDGDRPASAAHHVGLHQRQCVSCDDALSIRDAGHFL